MYFDIDTMWPVLAFIGCIILIAILLIFRPSDEKSRQVLEELKSSCEIDGNTLFVFKQSKIFSRILKIKPHKTDMYKYNPEKIHIGAVSVGGVTSGGIYKTGGDYSATYAVDGRYKLLYYIGSQEIKYIKLSNELAKKAKKSPIGKYLNGGIIEVIEDIKPSDKVNELMRLGQNTYAINLLSIEQATGYPTREKCEAIVAWLSDQ